MKSARSTPLLFIFFPILLHYSCVNSNDSKQDQKGEQIIASIQAHKLKGDTTFRLNFTTPVRAIFEDSKGNYWFGTWEEGVCRYDGRQLTYFNIENGLSHNQVRNIQEDQQGIIWFESGKGISSYDPKNERITTNSKRVYDSKNDWQSEPGDLWFKSDESAGYNVLEGQHGAYRFDGNDFIFQAFPLPEGGIRDNNSNFGVTSAVVRGKNNVLWFSTYAAAIGFDTKADLTNNKRFNIIDRNAIGLSEDHPHIGIRTICEDSKGILWIGANGSGIYKYDGESTTIFLDKDRLNRIKAKGILSAPFKVFASEEDADGNVWFGTQDTGAWKYDYDADELINYTTDDGFTSMTVMAIYKNRKGKLLFGMGDGSVCEMNIPDTTTGGVSFARRY